MRSLLRVAIAVVSALTEVSSSDRCDAEVAAAQTELNFASAGQYALDMWRSANRSRDAATTAAIEEVEYLAAVLEDVRNELYAAVLSIDGEASTNPRPIQKLKT